MTNAELAKLISDKAAELAIRREGCPTQDSRYAMHHASMQLNFAANALRAADVFVVAETDEALTRVLGESAPATRVRNVRGEFTGPDHLGRGDIRRRE